MTQLEGRTTGRHDPAAAGRRFCQGDTHELGNVVYIVPPYATPPADLHRTWDAIAEASDRIQPRSPARI